MTDIRYHAMPDGRRIACRYAPAAGAPTGGAAPVPALVFLPGYKSDMAGGKASAVFDHARSRGQASLLLDYSGCGRSSGDFADGTLSRWRDEVLALIAAHCPEPVVLIGSSMGGWLMLLVAQALIEREGSGKVVALVGIAPAPDFTDWGVSAQEAAQLTAGEVLRKPNPYGDAPMPTYPGFFAGAQANRVLDVGIAFDGPVRLLHGQADGDVPWTVSLRLSEALRSDDVRVTLIKDGDHRLSRDADIAALLATIDEVVAAAQSSQGSRDV